jgi:hypothetical protein
LPRRDGRVVKKRRAHRLQKGGFCCTMPPGQLLRQPQTLDELLAQAEHYAN